MRSIDELAHALAEGTTTSRALVEECLTRIEDPHGEGSRTFIRVYAAAARQTADAMDRMRAVGRSAGRYAGIPIAVKDLFDVAGEPTPAGSAVLADAPPAQANAPVIARVMAAGFVPVGRANMTEFAFSGLGINPHYGTPASPWDRASRRIPGGSSSGSAVAVADGMAAAALGTDTGGSCRIPAAFCGVAGYKPTARRVPIDGVLPLAPSLDSIGPIAPTVACCAAIDAILAGEIPQALPALPLKGLRLAVPSNMVLDDMDSLVTTGFDQALRALAQAGAQIVEQRFAAFDDVPSVNQKGGFAASEAYAWHRQLLAEKGEGYDPRIRVRIARGATMSAADYIELCQARQRLITAFNAETAGFDALLMPATPIIAPRIADLEGEHAYNRQNLLILRNTALANFFDRCSVSIPCHRKGEAPVGLMLVGETMGDRRLLSIARVIEESLGR